MKTGSKLIDVCGSCAFALRVVGQVMQATPEHNLSVLLYVIGLAQGKDASAKALPHKRIFTPLEQEKKYIDECVYEDTNAQTGIIREVVVLPDNDLLLGFYIPCCDTADEEDEYRHIRYS